MTDPSDTNTMAAVALSRMDAHERTCTERYATIAASMNRIESLLAANGMKLDDSTRRIHDRIDGTAAEARSNTNLAFAAATAAGDRLQKAEVKIWATAAAAAGAVLLWLADMLFGKHP